MVLRLHLSPAVFDYTDWTWLGKPHTCLYKTLQLTVHVRANENHEVKGTITAKEESQPSLQPSTSRGFMAEWPDGSLSSVQGTWKPAWSLLKNTWRTPRWWQIRFSGLMSPRYNFLALILSVMKTRHCSSPVQYSPNSETRWWQHHAVGVFFSCRDRMTGCNRGKDECGQVQGYPGRKPSPECSGPQTGLKVYLPTRQWP